MSIRRWPWMLLGLVLLAAAPAWSTESASPLETLKRPIDQIMSILNDPTYKAPDQREAQRTKIWQVARPMFDFTEISRRTVGNDWERFSPSEQSRFTDVFAEFLGNTYIDKIQGEYHNERIAYAGELIKGSIALVRTKLLRESIEIPIDYRMKKIDDGWKIYDVLVEEGVSLVKNYRVQFQSILQKETPAQLIQRLEQKLKEQNAPAEGQK